jgi:hypothetical protein
MTERDIPQLPQVAFTGEVLESSKYYLSGSPVNKIKVTGTLYHTGVSVGVASSPVGCTHWPATMG